MKCHYEILGIPQTATDDEIKRTYRKLALEWHPDKNPDRVQECTEYFAVIQQAYDVLSDPQERAWYDRHREQILSANEKFEDNTLNLFPFFTSTCYRGYGDDEKGFYSVYRHIFESIGVEDQDFLEDKTPPPTFGFAESDYDEVVHVFYAFWQSYSTARSYAWVAEHDIRQAENRRIVRLMEKENKKLRDAARKERNDQVRELVSFVRKRDKRVQKHKLVLEQRRLDRESQIKQERSKQLKKNISEYKESDWISKQAHENDLAQIEARLKEEFGEESNSDIDSETENENCEEIEMDALYCAACDKMFKSENTMQNHSVSKKHKENVAILKEQLAEEDFKLLNLSSGENNSKPEKTKKAKKNKIKESDNEDNMDPPNEDPIKDNEDPKPEIKIAPEKNPKNLECSMCGLECDSRNKLFEHLKESGHAAPKNPPAKEKKRKNVRLKK